MRVNLVDAANTTVETLSKEQLIATIRSFMRVLTNDKLARTKQVIDNVAPLYDMYTAYYEEVKLLPEDRLDHTDDEVEVFNKLRLALSGAPRLTNNNAMPIGAFPQNIVSIIKNKPNTILLVSAYKKVVESLIIIYVIKRFLMYIETAYSSNYTVLDSRVRAAGIIADAAEIPSRYYMYPFPFLYVTSRLEPESMDFAVDQLVDTYLRNDPGVVSQREMSDMFHQIYKFRVDQIEADHEAYNQPPIPLVENIYEKVVEDATDVTLGLGQLSITALTSKMSYVLVNIGRLIAVVVADWVTRPTDQESFPEMMVDIHGAGGSLIIRKGLQDKAISLVGIDPVEYRRNFLEAGIDEDTIITKRAVIDSTDEIQKKGW